MSHMEFGPYRSPCFFGAADARKHRLYLWFRNHSSRRIGVVALLIGVTTALSLILSMRSG